MRTPEQKELHRTMNRPTPLRIRRRNALVAAVQAHKFWEDVADSLGMPYATAYGTWQRLVEKGEVDASLAKHLTSHLKKGHLEWTHEEERTLIDLRASNTVEAIRPTMGRSYGSISGKLARI